MVIVSTVILLGAEIILPTSLPLLPLLVRGVAVETAIESAVLVWAFSRCLEPQIRKVICCERRRFNGVETQVFIA